ncbi:uncharacterized protein LOC128883713 isoform X1 [Hylaeus volcanicus]|uniref:uncharacterized protein LOC128883713 isoform X1 n=1 Tax=Hylaeus volcanicus TaxID=313075 RepID=UPI0023B7C2B6|nr:uncharacterized protein LOC128883713 isoform X1 [Hylaeus volcanicus]
MHYLNSKINNFLMLQLETLPLPCVYLELPWIPTRAYCRLLANTFHPNKTTDSVEQILCQLYSHVLSSIGFIQKNRSSCLEYLFVEKYNYSCFCIRQVLLGQFSSNQKSTLLNCMVTQKKSYQQVFDLSYKTVSASELFSLRLSKSQRRQGLYLKRRISYHHHEHIYIYQKRHSLDNLPLDIQSLNDYWENRIQSIEPYITTLVILLDFTHQQKFDTRGEVSKTFLNSDNHHQWKCENTRKIIHMTLQLNCIFLSQHVPYTVVIFHRLPETFSTFIQQCIEKSNTNITLGMNASSHQLEKENEIDESFHHHRRAVSLPLTLSCSHAVNKTCKFNQANSCKDTFDLSKLEKKQEKKLSEQLLPDRCLYKKTLLQRPEFVNSMSSTIPNEWFSIKKNGTLREIKYEPTLRMSFQNCKSTRQSMLSVICHAFCSKACGILDSSTLPLQQHDVSNHKPSTYSFLDDASSQSFNDDFNNPASRSNTSSQRNMYSNPLHYSDQTLCENVHLPSGSHVSLKSRRYSKPSSPKVVRSRNKIRSQNNIHTSSSSSLISLISTETDFTITSLDLVQPCDGRI